MGSDRVARVDTDREQRWRGGVGWQRTRTRAHKQASRLPRGRAHSERRRGGGAGGVQLPLGGLSKACCAELLFVWFGLILRSLLEWEPPGHEDAAAREAPPRPGRRRRRDKTQLVPARFHLPDSNTCKLDFDERTRGEGGSGNEGRSDCDSGAGGGGVNASTREEEKREKQTRTDSASMRAGVKGWESRFKAKKRKEKKEGTIKTVTRTAQKKGSRSVDECGSE